MGYSPDSRVGMINVLRVFSNNGEGYAASNVPVLPPKLLLVPPKHLLSSSSHNCARIIPSCKSCNNFKQIRIASLDRPPRIKNAAASGYLLCCINFAAFFNAAPLHLSSLKSCFKNSAICLLFGSLFI